MCPGVGLEGWLRRLAHHFGAGDMLSAGGMRGTLIQKWQLGFFGLFVSSCP